MLSTNTLSLIVSCIWQVEGGSNTTHPYGIMVKYAHTSAKVACENTVLHSYKDFSSLGLLVPTTTRRSAAGSEVFLKRRSPSNSPTVQLNQISAKETSNSNSPKSTRVPSPRTEMELITPLTPAFINFLGDRYCPSSVDKVGNERWKKNMLLLLKQKGLVLLKNQTK